MRNKLIAIAAIVMAPALASAQAGGGGGGHGGGNAAGQSGQSGQAATGGVSTGSQAGNAGAAANSGAANPQTTAEERHHDSLVVEWRKQHGQSGASVQQQATGGVGAADTGATARRDTTGNKATAQSDTTMRRDTTSTNASAQTDTSGLVKSSAAGGLATTRHRRSRNMGLSADQVKQLQQALNQSGCNAGPVDGRFGPETRQGVQCVRQQKNITENGLNPVLQALNLGFTASPSASSDSTSMGGHRRMHPDTTGTASQQYPSPKKAQHGKGMHDSTTSKSDTSHKQ